MKKVFLYYMIMMISGSAYAQGYSKTQIDQMIEEISKMANSEPDKVLPASFDCYNYSKNIGYKEGMANSLLLTGKGLLSLGQYDAALEYAAKSEAIAGKQHYSEIMCEACRLEAECYRSLGVEYQVYKMLQKAMRFTADIQDRNKQYHERGSVFSDMAHYYERMEKQDSALVYYENSDNVFSMMKTGYIKNRERSLAASGMAMICMEKEQYDLAELYLKKAEDLAGHTNGTEMQLKIFRNKGKLEGVKGNNEKAIAYYNDALILAKQLKKKEVQALIYHKLSLLYEKTGEEEKAIQCFLESHKISDHLEKNKISVRELPVKLVVENTEQQFKKNRTEIVVALSFGMLFILFLVARMIWYYKKMKEGLLAMKHTENQLKRKKAFLEKAKHIDDVTIEKVVQLGLKNDPQFLIQFAIIHLSFYERMLELKPSLKEEELKIGAMRKLGFSTKEIAIITDVSVRSVEARIYRIRKKIKEAVGEEERHWFEMI
ncbi:tetratricopeptide repeat protein [Flavobacterium sp.]|uniref:tetratricopeptide repeat protein n=1 Tax=Flavobacterium sp. TaxID=239 RepID=UPI00263197BC|nr:tetratricopeptide repeat protein [Flavobacterium sp.]